MYTNTPLGTFSASLSGNLAQLIFKPNPSIDVEVRVFQNALKLVPPGTITTTIEI